MAALLDKVNVHLCTDKRDPGTLPIPMVPLPGWKAVSNAGKCQELHVMSLPVVWHGKYACRR